MSALRGLTCDVLLGDHWWGKGFREYEGGPLITRCRVCRVSTRDWAGSIHDRPYTPPREDEAYPAGGRHAKGCRNIPIGLGPAREAIAIGDCVEGCPVMAEGIRHGQALAKELGW